MAEHYLYHNQFDNINHRPYLNNDSTRTIYWCNGCSIIIGKKVYMTKTESMDENIHIKICSNK